MMCRPWAANEQGQGERCVIHGRSDATINRHGLRMGTSEICSAAEALPEVLDSMVVLAGRRLAVRPSWAPEGWLAGGADCTASGRGENRAP